MAPLNEEQLHQIRDERKEQIKAAALQVFARKGILSAKMSMIAETAGISNGLLYHYFKSKDELFTSLVQEAMAESEAALRSVYDMPGTPLERIRALTAEILNEDGTPYFMLIHQAATSDGVPEQVKQLQQQYSMDTYVDMLLPLFEEGQQAGELAEGDPRELIVCYLSVLSGVMVINSNGSKVYQIPKADMLMRLVARK
ncbi:MULTISPECIES: TetR/AcrR family transcriptional regulator [Paenibacillus]|uniref:TetR family transcriptional regulator n=1 Tax=Paenibacillus cineris TaxID=237530 RepID=A0ABQ4L8V1_9BACL|nr:MULTISPECIES: TetR/AcrR family transcriptional regulator [Paenibacillus]OXL82373.1 TetR family transcriptional regulator [Paenibacillus sp. SSG-1]RED37304.1 TetR family transcriptional regulator [Paenibacillus sp. VMFN-D1]UYO04046.1 TetR/AcrR family transcriptional regulator [Paenibacillus sp. PSB04]GIO52710.1 TetR family transcriptional regulator [Paenibacillus cineris]